MFRLVRGLGSLLSLFITTSVDATTIGDAAENLSEPLSMLTDLVLFACYVVGAALIIGGIMQYRIHRQNPKQVPLTTPVFYGIMGAILLFMPYLSTVAKTWSLAKQTSNAAHDEAPYPTGGKSKEPSTPPPPTGGFWGTNIDSHRTPPPEPTQPSTSTE